MKTHSVTLTQKMTGFTLVELILFITLSSILAVALLASLRGPASSQKIDFGDVIRIGKNTLNVYQSWILIDQLCASSYSSVLTYSCPTPLPSPPAPPWGSSVICDSLSGPSNPLLCNTNMGSTTKYEITATVTDETLMPDLFSTGTPLLDVPAAHIEIKLEFYVKETTAGPWILHTTYNTEAYVAK